MNSTETNKNNYLKKDIKSMDSNTITSNFSFMLSKVKKKILDMAESLQKPQTPVNRRCKYFYTDETVIYDSVTKRHQTFNQLQLPFFVLQCSLCDIKLV